MKTRMLLAVLLLIAAGLVAPPTRALADPGNPDSWQCTSAKLGLDKVEVQRAPILASESEEDGSPITSAPAGDLWVPVVFVHGWTDRATHTDDPDKAGAFSRQINLTANRLTRADVHRSMIGQAQGIPGAAVFTYDYHPYSGRWVTDDHIGPGLGKVIDCLFKASGQKVIIVGHSMGGLAARYAATDREDKISRIITFGTPNSGSHIAGLADLALSALPTVRLILTLCGEISTKDMETDSICNWLPTYARAFMGEAGQALIPGSPELRQLATVPSAIPVTALAGDTRIQFHTTWFGIRLRDEAPGDAVVDVESATARSSYQKALKCDYEANIRRAVNDQTLIDLKLKAVAETPQVKLSDLVSPCHHNNLMRSIELTNEATLDIADDIRKRAASRCPTGVKPPQEVTDLVCQGLPVGSHPASTKKYEWGYSVQLGYMPSGNAGCDYQVNDGGLRCSIRERTWEFPEALRRQECIGPDAGPQCKVAVLKPEGSVTISWRDDVEGWSEVSTQKQKTFELAYGSLTRFGQNVCLSEKSGLYCWHQKTRHGFKLSRSSYALW